MSLNQWKRFQNGSMALTLILQKIFYTLMMRKLLCTLQVQLSDKFFFFHQNTKINSFILSSYKILEFIVVKRTVTCPPPNQNISL